MRKLRNMFLATLVMIFILFPGVVWAGSDIQVFLDNRPVAFDPAPVNENGRVMVPMRAIFEALGSEVQWDEKTKSINATKDDIKILLFLGQTAAMVNGETVTLQAPAKLINNRTFVPLRFVAEALGCEVNWDGETKQISITSAAPPQPAAPKIRVARDLGDKIVYYINGKQAAEVKVAPSGDKDTVYYGDNWVLTVTHKYYSSVSGSRIFASYLEEPFTFRCYNASSMDELHFPTDKWRTDPKIRQDQKDAIEFVLDEIEARNKRIRGY